MISWYEGDCFEVLKNELADLGRYSILFASPPWGGKPNALSKVWYEAVLISVGPGYRSDTIFDLAMMQPYTLTDLLNPFRQLTEDVVLYLPRTSDIRQLADESFTGEKTTVMHYCIEGASKVGCNPIQGFPYLTKSVGGLRVLRSFRISLSNQNANLEMPEFAGR